MRSVTRRTYIHIIDIGYLLAAVHKQIIYNGDTWSRSAVSIAFCSWCQRTCASLLNSGSPILGWSVSMLARSRMCAIVVFIVLSCQDSRYDVGRENRNFILIGPHCIDRLIGRRWQFKQSIFIIKNKIYQISNKKNLL